MFKLMKSKNGNFGLKLSRKFMPVFQNTIRRIYDGFKITEIDKAVLRSIHDYCWAWNKLDIFINDGVMNKDLNGHGEFDEILEKELSWWFKNRNIDPKTITSLKCTRCDTVVDRLDVMRAIELGEEIHCPQCPGQDFNGKQLKLAPA